MVLVGATETNQVKIIIIIAKKNQYYFSPPRVKVFPDALRFPTYTAECTLTFLLCNKVS